MSQSHEIRRAWTVIGTCGKQASPTPAGSAARERKSVGHGWTVEVTGRDPRLAVRLALATQPLGRVLAT